MKEERDGGGEVEVTGKGAWRGEKREIVKEK